jgi:hypothetical protein
MSGRKLILSPGELTVTDDRNGQGADGHAVPLVLLAPHDACAR